jgi:hypothetical protein
VTEVAYPRLAAAQIGYAWIGRIRNRDMVRARHGHNWEGCKTLHAKAGAQARDPRPIQLHALKPDVMQAGSGQAPAHRPACQKQGRQRQAQ